MSAQLLAALPTGVRVIERGWLSSNLILIHGSDAVAVIDSGYCTHAEQTVQLVASSAGGLPVATLVNTHLHSDHCGGNAALQAKFSGLRTLIPPGLADAVAGWDPVRLTYEPTGQQCPRFTFSGLVQPGSVLRLGEHDWEVHGAPGHDPDAVILFEPQSRALISADALWEQGFGVVFPELEGQDAFDAVGSTLDLIERLRPAVVIPGHGRVFADVSQALQRARGRLAAFIADPHKHAVHAAKVLLKFKLLELQRVASTEFFHWARSTPYFATVHSRWAPNLPMDSWISQLLAGLERSGAAKLEGGWILDA